jgi:hypothetical protein
VTVLAHVDTRLTVLAVDVALVVAEAHHVAVMGIAGAKAGTADERELRLVCDGTADGLERKRVLAHGDEPTVVGAQHELVTIRDHALTVDGGQNSKVVPVVSRLAAHRGPAIVVDLEVLESWVHERDDLTVVQTVAKLEAVLLAREANEVLLRGRGGRLVRVGSISADSEEAILVLEAHAISDHNATAAANDGPSGVLAEHRRTASHLARVARKEVLAVLAHERNLGSVLDRALLAAFRVHNLDHIVAVEEAIHVDLTRLGDDNVLVVSRHEGDRRSEGERSSLLGALLSSELLELGLLVHGDRHDSNGRNDDEEHTESNLHGLGLLGVGDDRVSNSHAEPLWHNLSKNPQANLQFLT